MYNTVYCEPRYTNYGCSYQKHKTQKERKSLTATCFFVVNGLGKKALTKTQMLPLLFPDERERLQNIDDTQPFRLATVKERQLDIGC